MASLWAMVVDLVCDVGLGQCGGTRVWASLSQTKVLPIRPSSQFQGNTLPGQWSFTVLSPVSGEGFSLEMPKLSIFRGPGKPIGLAAALAAL